MPPTKTFRTCVGKAWSGKDALTYISCTSCQASETKSCAAAQRFTQQNHDLINARNHKTAKRGPKGTLSLPALESRAKLSLLFCSVRALLGALVHSHPSRVLTCPNSILLALRRERRGCCIAPSANCHGWSEVWARPAVGTSFGTDPRTKTIWHHDSSSALGVGPAPGHPT